VTPLASFDTQVDQSASIAQAPSVIEFLELGHLVDLLEAGFAQEAANKLHVEPSVVDISVIMEHHVPRNMLHARNTCGTRDKANDTDHILDNPQRDRRKLAG
jgi:hypothetical protein